MSKNKETGGMSAKPFRIASFLSFVAPGKVFEYMKAQNRPYSVGELIIVIN